MGINVISQGKPTIYDMHNIFRKQYLSFFKTNFVTPKPCKYKQNIAMATQPYKKFHQIYIKRGVSHSTNGKTAKVQKFTPKPIEPTKNALLLTNNQKFYTIDNTDHTCPSMRSLTRSPNLFFNMGSHKISRLDSFDGIKTNIDNIYLRDNIKCMMYEHSTPKKRNTRQIGCFTTTNRKPRNTLLKYCTHDSSETTINMDTNMCIKGIKKDLPVHSIKARHIKAKSENGLSVAQSPNLSHLRINDIMIIQDYPISNLKDSKKKPNIQIKLFDHPLKISNHQQFKSKSTKAVVKKQKGGKFKVKQSPLKDEMQNAKDRAIKKIDVKKKISISK